MLGRNFNQLMQNLWETSIWNKILAEKQDLYLNFYFLSP